MLKNPKEGLLFYYVDHFKHMIQKCSILAISPSIYPILLVQDEMTGEHFRTYNDITCFDYKQDALNELYRLQPKAVN